MSNGTKSDFLPDLISMRGHVLRFLQANRLGRVASSRLNPNVACGRDFSPCPISSEWRGSADSNHSWLELGPRRDDNTKRLTKGRMQNARSRPNPCRAERPRSQCQRCVLYKI